jgi:triphosphoribosyl-dephospho-CoA synthetase
MARSKKMSQKEVSDGVAKMETLGAALAVALSEMPPSLAVGGLFTAIQHFLEEVEPEQRVNAARALRRMAERLVDEDEGNDNSKISVIIRVNKEDKIVSLYFGQPIEDLSLSPADMAELAVNLARAAREAS